MQQSIPSGEVDAEAAGNEQGKLKVVKNISQHMDPLPRPNPPTHGHF
jgi:hypothetical protein